MEQLKIGLEAGERKKICDFLNKLLASTYTLYLKTQNYHWNVKGMHFFSLHILFEKQYEELAESIDEMAERIRSLGHFAEGSFESYAKLSVIKGDDSRPSAPTMIENLLKDAEAIICFLRENLAFAEKVHDGATADFINKRLAVHEKASWMLRSHLAQ